MLDRYAAGKFDEVLTDLGALDQDFAAILNQLREHGPAWIDAGGPAARDKRRLVAATFAIEAARTDAWYEWKWIVRQPVMSPGRIPGERATRGDAFQPLNVLYWKAPPLLIEWACELLRKNPTPSDVERWWHMAAIAVAQRSEDTHFLIGDPAIGRGVGAGEIINLQDEIKHLAHAEARFPEEPRFKLAQGLARDRVWPADAITAYQALAGELTVGGEALTRLAALQHRMGRPADALKSLDRADAVTRDPYVLYLSAYVRGRILEAQKKLDEAGMAWERAVAVWPHGQAATLALSTLLFQQGRRAEAQELIGAMLAADPLPSDPWRVHAHGDDRLWPELIAKLRTEILR
jgi:tetratricopeptide (TPR) repeat protein